MYSPDVPFMILTHEEADLARQLFDAVQDMNPDMLDPADYELAKRLYEKCGMRVPNSIAKECV